MSGYGPGVGDLQALLVEIRESLWGASLKARRALAKVVGAGEKRHPPSGVLLIALEVIRDAPSALIGQSPLPKSFGHSSYIEQVSQQRVKGRRTISASLGPYRGQHRVLFKGPHVAPLVLHSFSVATTKPRIALVRDEELDRALATTQDALPQADLRSTAAQVRALALLGARAIERDPELQRQAALDRYLAVRYGVRPPRVEGDFGDLVTGEPDPDAPYAGTEALEWVRGKR